jgi:hypothetical protein
VQSLLNTAAVVLFEPVVAEPPVPEKGRLGSGKWRGWLDRLDLRERICCRCSGSLDRDDYYPCSPSSMLYADLSTDFEFGIVVSKRCQEFVLFVFAFPQICNLIFSLVCVGAGRW